MVPDGFDVRLPGDDRAGYGFTEPTDGRRGDPVEIKELTRIDEVLADEVRALVRQLSSSADGLTLQALTNVVDAGACTLFVAVDGGDIVGMLTLVVFPIPTGVRAWIEDVVVDGSARGQGVGSALTHRAVEKARATGARTVDLTSRPSRSAANSMYEKLGFERRDTNVYRLRLDA